MSGHMRQSPWWVAALGIGILVLAPAILAAQEAASAAPAAEASPLDAPADEPSAPEPAKTEPAKRQTAGLGERSNREVGPAEQLSFRQEQVAEEMRELEQRMFRLSETLKPLEPENSSRLHLGLKYARDELILHRMQELQEALAKLALSGAVDEQRLVLAKLERLQKLLLSTDLDFEMKLERLRAIREALRKLNAVVREETREEKMSKEAAEKERELAKLTKRRATLEDLIEQQTGHISKNEPLARQPELGDGEKQAVAKMATAQESTRKQTVELAGDEDRGGASDHLTAAGKNMQSAVNALGEAAPADAKPSMETALAELKKELDDVAKREAEAKEALSKEQLTMMREDQEANHRATDDVSEMTRGLGNNGTAALAELLRAGGFMNGAESAFGQGQAGAANGEQGRALEALKYAEDLLAEEAERLARQLRREVKKRVTEGLTEMLEEQIVVRKRTELLQPEVKRESRQALTALAALAKREDRITDIAQELINIVEETEFGIALPAALAAVRDATEGVQMSLADGDASDDVVKAEKRIEEDLKAMLEIVSEMSDANSRTGRRGGRSPEEQRKEQNRIISELKMLRLLQDRVRQSTKETDGKRATASLSQAMRRRIEFLEGRQEDIRDATELLAEERGDEVPAP